MKSPHRILVLILIVCAFVMGAAAQKSLPPAGLAIVSIDAQGRLKLGGKATTLTRLRKKLAAAPGAPASELTIYIKAGAKVPFSQLVKLLKLGRETQIDTFGLLPVGKDDTSEAVTTKIELRSFNPIDVPKPNPLYLGLTISKSGKMALNGESVTTKSLTTKLQAIVEKRTYNGVTRPGTNDIELTVFLVPSTTATFDTILRAARTVKEAGMDPIMILIDKPQQRLVNMGDSNGPIK